MYSKWNQFATLKNQFCFERQVNPEVFKIYFEINEYLRQLTSKNDYKVQGYSKFIKFLFEFIKNHCVL